MKGVIFLFSVLVVFTLGACSVAEEDVSGVGQRLQDGFQGRGKIVPVETTHDSFGPDYR